MGREDGLTLIELLVVVVIIGILAAISVPRYLDQRRRAYGTQALEAASFIAVEVETAAATRNGRLVGPGGAFADEAAFDGFVTSTLASQQGGVQEPVTYDAAHGTVATTRYEMCFQHVQLTDGGVAVWSVTYVSDGGGLQRPIDGPC